MPDHTSSLSDNFGLVHWQSVALSCEHSVGSSQSQFHARNIVGCPSLLVAALVSDPPIVMMPLIAPPNPSLVTEWLQRNKPVKQPVAGSNTSRAATLAKNFKKNIGQKLLNSNIRIPPVAVINPTRVTKSTNPNVADDSCSSLDDKSNSTVVSVLHDPVKKNLSSSLIDSISDCTELSMAISSPSSSSVNRPVLGKTASVDTPIISNVHETRSITSPAQSSDLTCIPNSLHEPLSGGAGSSGTNSEGIRLSGVVAETGSDSTLLSSQRSYAKLNVSKASRIELELPQSYQSRNIRTSCVKKVIDDQGDFMDAASTSNLSLSADPYIPPLASTPYSRPRSNSIIRDKLIESPINCIPNTPRRASVTDCQHNNRAKPALRLNLKQDIIPAITSTPQVI